MRKFNEAWYEARVAEFKAPLDREYPKCPETNRFLAERRVEAILENQDEGDDAAPELDNRR